MTLEHSKKYESITMKNQLMRSLICISNYGLSYSDTLCDGFEHFMIVQSGSFVVATVPLQTAPDPSTLINCLSKQAFKQSCGSFRMFLKFVQEL